MTQPEKLKVMLKYEKGFIGSKRQMKTYKDGLVWVIAKSSGLASGVEAAGKIFEEHGHEVVEWDDDVEWDAKNRCQE